MSATDHDGIDESLARSVVYRYLSVGLRQPVADARESVAPAVPTVVAALQCLDRGSGGTLSAVAAHLSAAKRPAVETIAERFVRLFGHTARGQVSACETEYGADNAFHQPQQLADIAGYYLAFGLQPSPASDTRVDHIACECEFMDFLNRKTVWLESREHASSDDRQTLDLTRRAAHDFLRDHLARFGCAFAARLASEDAGGYFGDLGQLLLAVLDADCDRLGISRGPTELPLRPEKPDETPMACGSACCR